MIIIVYFTNGNIKTLNDIQGLRQLKGFRYDNIAIDKIDEETNEIEERAMDILKIEVFPNNE